MPRNQDLFTPKALVTTVGSTIVVSNHDADAHNFVIDPASPSGAAFIIDGTAGEPPSGWQRDLIVQQPGLYHVYCTMHTKVIGTADGWHLVAPRPPVSGYHDHNPMEAWIVVLAVASRLGPVPNHARRVDEAGPATPQAANQCCPRSAVQSTARRNRRVPLSRMISLEPGTAAPANVQSGSHWSQ